MTKTATACLVFIAFVAGFFAGGAVAAHRWPAAWREENRIQELDRQNSPPPAWWWQDQNGNMIRGVGQPPSA